MGKDANVQKTIGVIIVELLKLLFKSYYNYDRLQSMSCRFICIFVSLIFYIDN